jgi:hypothetical protein
MGSGAFLVAVCRYLAGWLVKAWDNGDDHKAPTDSTLDKDLYARRLIAQSCLYGVDKNPFAVNLAKLSLWLCQPTSKTEPLPTLKTEPPPTRSGAPFPEWFRLGCAGGASACSWFSDWLRWLTSVIDAGGAVAAVFPSGLLGWRRWR